MEKSIAILEKYNQNKPQLCFSAFEYCDENLNHLRNSDVPPEKITFLRTFFQCYMWGFTTVFNESFRQKFIKRLPVKTRDEDYWFHMMAVGFGEIHYNPEIQQSIAVMERTTHRTQLLFIVFSYGELNIFSSITNLKIIS